MKTQCFGSRRFVQTLVVAIALSAPAFSHAARLVAGWGENLSGQTCQPSGLSSVKAVAAGASFSLALKTDGTVVAWGQNESHQTEVPAGLRNVASISAGGYHCLALTSGGTVVAWGRNLEGQTNVPPGLPAVIAVAGGATFSLALKADGTVTAWGNNAFGQTDVPTGLSKVVAIAAGGGHAPALRADGSVVAWGNYLKDEPGDPGGLTNLPSGLANVVAVAAGGNHNLALRDDGTVAAWGANSYGQTNVPAGLSNVIAIAAGASHSLALRADGTIVAWGLDTAGQTKVPTGLTGATALAAGGYHSLAVVFAGPVQILQGPVSQGVPLTSNATFSVVASGWEPLAYQWFHDGQAMSDTALVRGSTNSTLMISNAAFADRGAYHVIVSNALGSVLSTDAVLTVISPPFITSQTAAKTVPAGSSVLLSVLAEGTPPMAYAWIFQGTNLGGGTTAYSVLSAQFALPNAQPTNSGIYTLWVSNAYGRVQADISLTVTDSAPRILSQPVSLGTIGLGSSGTFTVSARGSLPLSYQWRFNGVDLPGATNTFLNLPALRVDQSGYYNVVVRNAFGEVVSAKALLTVVQVLVWGSTSTIPNTIPPGLTNVIAVSAGPYHVLALKANGAVATWISSSYYGQPSLTNVPPAVNNVVGIAAGGSHSVALRANGTVIAWGVNTAGQTNVPTNLSNVIAIAAGGAHTLALKSNGTVVAWGYSYDGQTTVPTSLSNVIAITAGSSHSLALKRDGTVVAWGNNSHGQSKVPAGLSNVIAIAASYQRSLALKADGSLSVWGYDPPATPAAASNAVAIAAAGNSDLLALKADGGLVQWGGRNIPPQGLTNVIAIAASVTSSSTGFFVAAIGSGSPAITIQPVSQTAAKGTTVQFHARFVGVPPVSYQWQLNGQNLPGATNASLSLTNVQGKDIGGYRLVAANALGTAVSATANLAIPFAGTLADALNTPNLLWTNAVTTVPWFAQNRETHDGDAAAQSGPTADDQWCILQTTVVGPGTLTFWWKVSSEPDYDFLIFYARDSRAQVSISGETDWQMKTFTIGAGEQTLWWIYGKDASVSVGQDAGWVDQVSFTPDPPVMLHQPTSQTAGMGQTATFQAAASGTPPLTCQWLKTGTNLPGATNFSLTLTNLTRRDSTDYAARITNPGGSVLSSNATLTVRVPQRLSVPVAQPDGSFVFTSGDADGGALEAGDVAGFEAQASSNLANWVTLTNASVLTNGVLQVQDSDAPNHPMRFYRMVER